jgi:hypothetical protein
MQYSPLEQFASVKHFEPPLPLPTLSKSTVQTPPFVKTRTPSELGSPPLLVQEPCQCAEPLACKTMVDSGAPWPEQLVEHWNGAVLTLPLPMICKVVVTDAGTLVPRFAR